MKSGDCGGYGIRNGRLLSIAEVERGLRCDCRCPQCGTMLVAKKGTTRRHHFAHSETTECRGALETALHLLSKELIAQLDTMLVPPYEYDKTKKTRTGYPVQHKAKIASGGTVAIQKVSVEKHEGNFVADIVIESDGKPLIVEVAVTHKVARDKLRKLRRRNLPALEIQLESADSYVSRDELKLKLQNDIRCKKWLFHPRQRDAEHRFNHKYRAAVAASWLRKELVQSIDSRRTETHSKSEYRLSWTPENSEVERQGEQFRREYGRYPTLDECRERWPHLFTRRKT